MPVEKLRLEELFQLQSGQQLIQSEIPIFLAEIFRVLGDSTRIKIILALLSEEKCVYHLADAVGMSQSAVSHQLRVLKSARLVKARREGKNIVYSLDDGHIEGLVGQGLEHVAHNI